MRFSAVLQTFQNRHFLSLTGNGVMALFSLLSNAMLFRLLSEREMGNWVIYQMTFMFIDSFRTGFLQTALIKFYSGSDSKRKKEIAGATWYVGILITALFVGINFVAFLALPYVQDESFSLTLKWFAITLILTLPYSIAFWVLQAEQRFDRILYIRLINQGSFILCLLFIHFYSDLNLYTVIISFVVTSGLSSLFCLLFKWAKPNDIFYRTKTAVTEVYDFGKYSVGSYISTTLLRTSNSFFVKALLGPAAVAIYNLPSRLLEIIEILIRSFAATGMPSMSAASNQNRNDEVQRIMKKYAGMITIILIPIIVLSVIFAPYLVYILGGHKYAGSDSVNIFRIMIIIAVFFPLDRFLGIALDTINKPKINFIKVLVMLAVNIISVLVCLYFFKNIFGVVLSNIFTVTAGMFYSYFMLRKFINLRLKGILALGYREFVCLVSTLYKKVF